jgi:alkaline phosphatase D
MHFSRREILKGMGAAGITPLLTSACSSSSGGDSGMMLPDLPELPEYQWDGPIGLENLFEHGVASGDPLPEGVILWTRVTPEAPGPVEVWWEMALDEAFLERTAQGTFTTDASRDFTVKVDVPGLVWGRNYYYRFAAQGRWSPLGRTRLAPKSNETSKLRFGVCSCANYALGYFYGYRHMAERADLDAIIHLGDYYYEYGNDPDDAEQLRALEPPHETVTLDDYRKRFSQCRRDPNLRELHRQTPFIVVWDDHETANNSWMGGAENHTSPDPDCQQPCDPEGEGDWSDRVAAARQAFFEWIPIRDNPGQKLYRNLRYGDLAEIIMLDTRIEGREEQLGAPAFPPDEPNLPDQILGVEQQAWLFEQLENSSAKWKVLGNQVLMSLWKLAPGTYGNDDQWQGYKARNDLMSFLRDNQISNVVVLTGDVHSSWAMDVTIDDGSYTEQMRDAAVAVEFVAPGISSPPGIPPEVAEIFARESHVRDYENERRGYLILDLQIEKAQSDWFLLDGVREGEGNQALWASWAVMDGQRGLVEMSGPEEDNADAPDLAPA